MNKRAIIGAAVLFSCGWSIKATETTYTLKVMALEKAAGRVEAKFVTLPEDLRIVCEGDISGIMDSDYVPVTYHDGEFYIRKAKCTKMKWLK